MSLTLTLPQSYSYVLMSAVALGFQCFVVGFTVAQMKRKKYFTKEFLAKNFGEQHKKEFGTTVPQEGYPDHGSGRYSEKLSYRAWFELNNAQRCHQNFIETFAILILSILIAGLRYSHVAAGLGAAHFIGRIIYIVGYTLGGGDYRKVGAVIAHGSTFFALVLAFAASAKLANLF